MLSRRSHLHVIRLEDRLAPSLTPAGPEFRVNAWTTNQQRSSAAAADAQGNFVVAWFGYNSGSLFPGTHCGVSVQRYAANGSLIGGEIPVQTTPTELIIMDAACNASGQFVAAWEQDNFSEPTGIYARAFNADGTPAGDTIEANGTGDNYLEVNVSMADNGDYLLTYKRVQNPGTPYQTQEVGRVFHLDGTPATDEFAISSTSPNSSTGYVYSSIAPDGTFYSAWTQPSGSAMRHFSMSGQPLSPEINLGSSTTAANPRVVANPYGGVSVFYQASGVGLKFRQFDGDGIPAGPAVTVASNVAATDVARDANGGFIATYSGGGGIYAVAITADGALDGTAVLCNSPTAFDRGIPSVGVNGDGDAVVTWTSWNQDGNLAGIYARRFAGDAPSPQPMILGNGTTNRSNVKGSELNFTRKLVLPSDSSSAFVLTGPTGVMPVTVDASASTPAGAKLKLTFPALPDGHYTLRALASQIHDMDGQALDGNGDGLPGDDYVTTFHTLSGDFNGDAKVDAADFMMLRLNFLSSNATFDMTGDGHVDSADLLQFRLQFLKMLV